jgi:hypothetical protein
MLPFCVQALAFKHAERLLCPALFRFNATTKQVRTERKPEIDSMAGLPQNRASG